jgi:teichuronic acid exporter
LATTALFWSSADSLLSQVIRFGTGVVLARLLSPAEFGLIGMLTVFLAVTQPLADAGFGSALLLRRPFDNVDASSVLYFNMAAATLLAGSLWVAAPSVAAFYEEPSLTVLLRALTLATVADACGVVPAALLARELNFRTQFAGNCFAAATAGIVSISMALSGWGVWSLVAQQLCVSACRTISLYYLSRWRPVRQFSIAALRSMSGFSSRLFASALLNSVFDNLYSVVIGKLYSTRDLGLFVRARTLQDLPSVTLTSVLSKVTLPAFATIRSDVPRLGDLLRRGLRLVMMINTPVMAAMALYANEIIHGLLGPRWSGAVPYFRILCATGVLLPLHAMNLNLLLALGRSDLFLRLEIVKKLLIVGGIVLTAQRGVEALVWSMVAVSAVAFVVNCRYTGQLAAYPLAKQTRDFVPFLLLSGTAAGSALFAGSLNVPPALSFLLQTVAAVGAYLIGCWLFAREVLLEGFDLLRVSLTAHRHSSRVPLVPESKPSNDLGQ